MGLPIAMGRHSKEDALSAESQIDRQVTELAFMDCPMPLAVDQFVADLARRRTKQHHKQSGQNEQNQGHRHGGG